MVPSTQVEKCFEVYDNMRLEFEAKEFQMRLQFEAKEFQKYLEHAEKHLDRDLLSDAFSSIEMARQIPGYREDSRALDLDRRIQMLGRHTNINAVRCLKVFEKHAARVGSVAISC